MRLSLFIFLGLFGFAYAETKTKHPFEFYVVDYVKFRIVKFDRDGKLVWEHKPKAHVWDFEIIGENEMVYPVIVKPRELRCLNIKEQTFKWKKPYFNECQEIINLTRFGDQLIVSAQAPAKALFMNFKGEIQNRISVKTKYKHKHGMLGNIYAVGKDRYLAQLWGDGSASEFDEKGQEVWRFDVPKVAYSNHHPAGTAQDVLRLDNGNTMIACGTQARILEVNPKEEIVWQFKKDDYPEFNFTNACSLQKLKNGSILVTNFIRSRPGKGVHGFILSKNKKDILWTFKDHKNVAAASKIWAIEN